MSDQDELIKQYEEENPGKNAFWRGNETKAFEEWLEAKGLKQEKSEDEKDSSGEDEINEEEKSPVPELKEELKGKKAKKGDMVKVDIFGKTIEVDARQEVVFQASNPQDAKKLLSYDPLKEHEYIPELAIVGKKGFIMDQIDAKLEGLEFGEEKVIDLESEEAFGKREAKNIERIPIGKYKKVANEMPKLGATYNDKKGRQGRVIKIGSGRIFVDFNHPLSGKKIQYRVKVVDLIENFEDKVRAFIGRRMPGPSASMFEFKHDPETRVLDIIVPQMLVFQLAQQQGGIYFKMGVSYDLQDSLDEVGDVRFIELFEERKEPEHDHDNCEDPNCEHDHGEEE